MQCYCCSPHVSATLVKFRSAQELMSAQDATRWLNKARLSERSERPRTELLSRMARALQLLSARAAASDSAGSLLASQKVPLIAPWASRAEDEPESSLAIETPADTSAADAR